MNVECDEFSSLLDKMTSSLSVARTSLQSIKRNSDHSSYCPQKLDMTSGISLLSLKHHILVSYLRSLTLISSRRVLGETLVHHSLHLHPFNVQDRGARSAKAGDIVDSLVENRVVLEKIEALETRMRYQIGKFSRLAEEPIQKDKILDDPLSFRPNPASLVQPNGISSTTEGTVINSGSRDDQVIYCPPRMVPIPYIEGSKAARRNRPHVPSALASLSADSTQPFIESTSGLGAIPALASGRAQYLKRMKDFEEENFTRLVLKKSDAKKRAREEEDLALGGDLSSVPARRNRQRAGGLEDEFSGILRSVHRAGGGSHDDGYEKLRMGGRRTHVLQRSRAVSGGADGRSEEAVRSKKRSRFELDMKVNKKRKK